MAYTLITGNNTTFTANVQWNFVTSAATRSKIYIKQNNNAALTFQATVTNPTTGTFNILNIKGRRTDSSSSYQNVNSAWINVNFDNASSWTTNNKCNVYFNTKSTSWSTAPNWTKAGSTFTYQKTSVAVGTGKYLNIKTQGTQATINKQFNTTVNCGVAVTKTYSKDNSTFQSSATFTGLTPNTSYTLYMKTVTNAGGATISTNYDSRSLKTPCNAPSNLKLSMTDDYGLYGYRLMAGADGDTNAPIAEIKVFFRKAGTTEFTDSVIADSNGYVDFIRSEPWPEIECLIAAKNDGGSTYAMSIPQEYQEVEYIQTTGTQCINTGYQFGCNNSIHCHFKFQGTPTAQSVIFGNKEGSPDGSSGFSVGWYVNSDMGMSWFCQDGYNNNIATSQYWDNLVHDYRIDSYYNDGQGCVAIGNSAWTTMPTTFTRTIEHSARNLMIGCFNSFGTPSGFVNGYFYKTCILEDDVPVALFVPCYRKSDNVIGMYDPIRKIFLTNYGTGDFTKSSTNVTTASTTFWSKNPAIWIKTANGWQKRKYLWQKYSTGWDIGGWNGNDCEAGVKIKQTTATSAKFIPVEYIENTDSTWGLYKGKTMGTWLGCKTKLSITSRQDPSGPCLYESQDAALKIIPNTTQFSITCCKSVNTYNWVPTLGRPFILTYRADKTLCTIEDNGNIYSVLTNMGKDTNRVASGYVLNCYSSTDRAAGTYGFLGKVYYYKLYSNGHLTCFLVPVKITQNPPSGASIGDGALYDIITNTLHTNTNIAFTAGPEVNTTGWWREAYDR